MGANEENKSKMAQIIAKAWSNATFKQKLKANPTQVLKEFGIAIPANTSCEVVENTASKVYLLIPAQPSGNLSEEELTKIAAARGDFLGMDIFERPRS